ncbi:hypothetical protein LP420_01625 [Massilia sp. B-10]|nr:hypothetical protein LP420_01625 [Massilia sp. B-10]
MKFIVTSTLTILLGTAVAQAQSASLYVAPDGNDGNPGTQSDPLRSLARCAQARTLKHHGVCGAGHL